MKHLLSITFLALGSVVGQQPSTEVFKDPEFQKRFMGSYGFLPDVEPSIDTNDEEERAYFLSIKELLAADNMAALKAKLQQDINPELSNPALIFMLANIWFQEDNNAEAEKWYQLAIKRFPSYLRAHKNLGLVYFRLGDNTKAIESLSEAVRLGDHSAQTVGLLGACHMGNENWLAAESALRQAVVLEPEKKQWKNSLLKVFFESGQYEAALGMVEPQLRENPNDDKLWAMKARALMELGRQEDATVAFETLHHMGKATPQILEILGAIYMDQEKPNAALKAYTAAAKGSQKLKGSSVLRTANLLFGYQYVDQAKRYVSQLRPRVKELTPAEQLELKTLEAKIARLEGNVSRAMTTLEEIILKDHLNGDARIELAQLYENLAREAEEETKKAEHYARAQLYFDQALQIPDSEALAALRYGQMLVRKSDYIKAVPLLQRSYRLRPKDEVDQYVKRVERAARQQEAKEAELKKAQAPLPGTKKDEEGEKEDDA